MVHCTRDVHDSPDNPRSYVAMLTRFLFCHLVGPRTNHSPVLAEIPDDGACVDVRSPPMRPDHHQLFCSRRQRNPSDWADHKEDDQSGTMFRTTCFKANICQVPAEWPAEHWFRTVKWQCDTRPVARSRRKHQTCPPWECTLHFPTAPDIRASPNCTVQSRCVSGLSRRLRLV